MDFNEGIGMDEIYISQNLNNPSEEEEKKENPWQKASEKSGIFIDWKIVIFGLALIFLYFFWKK